MKRGEKYIVEIRFALYIYIYFYLSSVMQSLVKLSCSQRVNKLRVQCRVSRLRGSDGETPEANTGFFSVSVVRARRVASSINNVDVRLVSFPPNENLMAK